MKSRTRPTLAGAALISGGLRMAAQMVTWVITLGTVRFLTPSDYGLAGLAMSCVTFPAMLVDCGLAPAIQAMPEQPHRTLARAHGLSSMVGVVTAGLVVLLATPLAHFFGRTELRALLMVASLNIILEALRAVPTAVALRTFQFGLVARTDFQRAIVGGVVTCGLAWFGAGAWSIVIGALVTNTASMVRLLRGVGLPWQWPEFAELRALLAYGRLLLTSRAMWQTYANADALSIGRVLSAAHVGDFTVAKTFAKLPQEKLLSVLLGVTTSFFADRASNPTALKSYLLELTELVALLMGLPLVGLMLVSDDVLPLVLGAQWTEVSHLLRLLVPGVLVSCVGVLANQIATVRGRAAAVTWGSIAAALAAFPIYGFGALRFGASGTAAGSLLVMLLIYAPGFRTALRETDTSLREYVQAFLPLVWSGLSVALVVLGVRYAATSHAIMSPIALSALMIGAGALTGLVVALVTGGPGVKHALRILRERWGTRRHGAPS